MKKFIAILLVALLALTTVFAQGAKETATTAAPATAKTEITWW